MTVRYSADVATSTIFSYVRVLFRWRGSLWKSVLFEILIWCICYFILKIVYTYAMKESQREVFEDITIFCNNYSSLLPTTFMLGFYVNVVFTRWQRYWDNIGWIDTPSLAVAAHIKGTSEIARNIRRSIIRYLIFVQALVFRDISVPVHKRYPTMKHLVDAGFISNEELDQFDGLATGQTKYYLPIQWALSLLVKARELGFVTSDQAMVDVTDKLYHWRETVVSLTFNDFVQIPLAYTQMINLVVGSFYFIAIMGRQFIHPKRKIPGFVQSVDPIVPILSILELTFIVGWTKVSEIMLNPMGQDDDDFETNFMLERNLRAGMAIADSHYGAFPPIKKDIFWEDPVAEAGKGEQIETLNLPKALSDFFTCWKKPKTGEQRQITNQSKIMSSSLPLEANHGLTLEFVPDTPKSLQEDIDTDSKG